MPGDPSIGALLRELRTVRGATLASVARAVGCTESLLSQVENGKRQLQPWLADQLDRLFDTGSTVAALLAGAYAGAQGRESNGQAHDVLLVRLPGKGSTVPVSRRALLTGLGIGALSQPLRETLEQALGNLRPTEETVRELRRTLEGLQAAGRTMAPDRIVNPLLSQVVSIDALAHRAPSDLRRDLFITQARYAECLSWMHEEGGDSRAASYWIDRGVHWAQAAGWMPMVAYSFVRRSMLAISHASDGRQAVENARTALSLAGGTHRIRALAAKQMAFGYALVRQRDDSQRALDLAMDLFGAVTPDNEEESGLGQRSVANDDLLTIFQTTCDVYLGRGDSVIPVLAPRLSELTTASARTHAISSAKLAHAYANAGEAETACRLIMETVDAADTVGSLSARRELQRALPALRYWSRRSDVEQVIARLGHLP